MDTKRRQTRDAILTRLALAHAEFHTILGSVSEQDLRRQSLNPGWTNGEILAHMLFGFVILSALLPMARLWGRLPKGSSKLFAASLNGLTSPFNWVNAIGARLQARVFTYRRIGKIYDWIYSSLLKQIASIRDDEWERGMYYPTHWDSNFSEFMTIEKLLCYPIVHFDFHKEQIAR